MVDYVGIYGSKAAEGLSAFQRRSCLNYQGNGCFIYDTVVLIIMVKNIHF